MEHTHSSESERHAAESQKHGAIGHLSADEELQQAVCEALIASPRLDSKNVGVSVANGTVILSGSVPTEEARELAQRIAEEQPGVVDVDTDPLDVGDERGGTIGITRRE